MPLRTWILSEQKKQAGSKTDTKSEFINSDRKMKKIGSVSVFISTKKLTEMISDRYKKEYFVNIV